MKHFLSSLFQCAYERSSIQKHEVYKRINQDACTAECIVKRIQKDVERELIKIEILPWYHTDSQKKNFADHFFRVAVKSLRSLRRLTMGTIR